MGRATELRTNRFEQPAFLDPSLHSNELVDGSIIDVCGVTLLFQKPQTMALELSVSRRRLLLSTITNCCRML